MSQTSVAWIWYRRCRGCADFQSCNSAEELEQHAYFMLRGCRLVYFCSLSSGQRREKTAALPRPAHAGRDVRTAPSQTEQSPVPSDSAPRDAGTRRGRVLREHRVTLSLSTFSERRSFSFNREPVAIQHYL